MVQPISRVLKLLLLLYWLFLSVTPLRCSEYGSMGVYYWSEDKGQETLLNIALGLFYLGLVKLGDYLDEHPMAGYTCPDYCEVDHKHYRETEYEEKDKESTHKQRDIQLSRSDIITDTE